MRWIASSARDGLAETLKSDAIGVETCGSNMRCALRAGLINEETFNLTKINRWFLVQIKEILDCEEELATAKN